MNYRHSYHAGNFADVIKHVTLITLINALKRKETPFCFLDTHAGIGLYELQSEQAQKTQEYKNGVEKLSHSNIADAPIEIQHYIRIIQQFNVDNTLQYYPGSPVIAEALLRENDQMILSELHKEDIHTLKDYFFKKKSVAVHHIDAYHGMKAFLPPKQKRGLVLIDPAFEVTDECDRIVSALQHSLKHWRSGHFMIWYPIKDQTVIHNFYKAINALSVDGFAIDFSLNETIDSGKLSRCGLLLLNPPWKVRENLAENILPFLSKKLAARWKMSHFTLS